MSKFNTPQSKPLVKSPMTTTGPALTHEGGAAFVRDPRSELFLLAVTNMVGEDTFYEKAGDRDARYRALVHEVAIMDYEWMKGFIPWLRGAANMRSAPLVAACEAVKARLDANLVPAGRELINAACQRADEPGEILAYWTSRYGRKIPKPVKRGVADAVTRLYDGKSVLKYDSAASAFRFGDVIDLVHPLPAADKPWQGDLFRYVLDRRHNRDDLAAPAQNKTLTARQVLMQVPVEQRRAALLAHDGPQRLAEAGMTWEAVAGWLQGPMDAKAWEAIIPSMGTMALVRNLRNFDEAGVSDEVAARVSAKLSDPEEVLRSRQFPYRMFSAQQQVPSQRWGHALDKALEATCRNIPALPGRTLVLVDTSSSMTNPVSSKSKIRHVDVGALIGVALSVKSSNGGGDVDLYGFAGDGWGYRRGGPVVFKHELRKGGSMLKQTEEFTRRVGEVGHGTMIVEAVQQTFQPGVHQRVVIVTDMQTFPSQGGVSVSDVVPPEVPMFGINTSGYKATALDLSKKNRFEIGGFNDKVFTVMELLSRGRDSGWPWEQ